MNYRNTIFYPYVLFVKSFYLKEERLEWQYQKNQDVFGLKLKFAMLVISLLKINVMIVVGRY